MIWEVIGGMAIGVAVVEYYRRVNDRIRQEQIRALRDDARPEPAPRRSARREPMQEELEWAEAFDGPERPTKRRIVPVITEGHSLIHEQRFESATGMVRFRAVQGADCMELV